MLEKRFGNRFIIADTFRTKLNQWNKLAANDAEELQQFSNFITQCVAAKEEILELGSLDDS